MSLNNPEGIGNLLSQVSKTTDAYRNNPRALEQQTKVKSGVMPDLIKLISLQQLKKELEAKERNNILSLENTGKTVANQLGEDVVQKQMSSVNDKLTQVANTLNQKKMAQNKAMNNLVKNATKFRRPTVPMGVMNTGVANIPRKNTRSLANGGIVGYSEAGEVEKNKINKNTGLGKKLLEVGDSVNPLRSTYLDVINTLYNVDDSEARSRVREFLTAPKTTEVLEGGGGEPINLPEIVKKAPEKYDPVKMMRINEIPKRPDDSEFDKDGDVKVVNNKPSSGGGGSSVGGLGGMYFDLMQQIREQRQAEDPYRGLRYILGQAADPYNIPTAAERFRRGEEAVARADAGTAMGFNLKGMEIGARAAAAKIAAEANAIAKSNMDLNRKQALLQTITKEYNDLTMRLGSIGTNNIQVQALLRQANELNIEYNKTKDPKLMEQINDIQYKEIPRVLSDVPEVKRLADAMLLLEKQVYGTRD